MVFVKHIRETRSSLFFFFFFFFFFFSEKNLLFLNKPKLFSLYYHVYSRSYMPEQPKYLTLDGGVIIDPIFILDMPT